MTKPNILFVNGTQDSSIVKIKCISKQGIEQINPGHCDLFHFLNSDQITKSLFHLDINPLSNTNLPQNISLIVNQIVDADSHSKSLRKLSQQLIQQDKIPIINPPEQVINTRRELMYKHLHKLPNVTVPKTIRVQPLSPLELLSCIDLAEINFPAFICEAGPHEKQTTILLKDKESVLGLHALAMDGRDFYVTQSVDCEKKGLDFVYRILVIDGIPHLRQIRPIAQRTVEYDDYKTYLGSHPEIIQKEETMFHNFEKKMMPRLQKYMNTIQQQVKLDYFGVDCCLFPDGRLCVFEVNANKLDLNHQMPYPYYTQALEKIHSSILKLLFNRTDG